MKDLVERLRANTSPEIDVWSPKNEALRFEAADEIARLREIEAERDELQRKLDDAKEIILACMPILRVDEFYKLEERGRAWFAALSQKDEGQ